MSKKTKTTTGPSKQALPYLIAGSNAVQSAYNQNAPQVQEIASMIQGGLPGLADKAFGSNPLVAAAQGYNTDVLSGKYLDAGNPYLAGRISSTADDVTNRVNGAIGLRGRTGGDAHSRILGRELANAENTLRYNDYGSERDRMAAAAAGAPGLASAEYAGIAPFLAAAQAGAEIPFTASNNLASALAGLWGNSQTTTQKQGLGSTLGGLLGAGLSGWASGGFKGI